MTIDEAITGMNDAEARAYVLAQFEELPLPPPFAVDDVTVIVQAKVVDDRGLVVDAIAVRGDRMIALPLGAMPIVVPTPAWKVSDGTSTQREITTPDGQTRTAAVGNLIEDLPAALRHIIAVTVRGLIGGEPCQR